MDNIDKKLDDIIERQMEYMEQCGMIHEQIASLTAEVRQFKTFADEIKTYYIDRQEHFRQHQFLSEFIKYSEQCKSIVLKSVLTALIAGILGLMYLGFALKNGGH